MRPRLPRMSRSVGGKRASEMNQAGLCPQGLLPEEELRTVIAWECWSELRSDVDLRARAGRRAGLDIPRKEMRPGPSERSLSRLSSYK